MNDKSKIMSLLSFFEEDSFLKEKQRRICVALWAWAYEKHSDSLVSDAKYDETCKKIDVSVKTDNQILDNFFQKHFGPETGQWVHKHPEKHKLELLYQRIRKQQ